MNLLTKLLRFFERPMSAQAADAMAEARAAHDRAAAERAARMKMIGYMHELGGFDPWLHNDAQNWARQLEVMAQHERRLADLERTVEALRKGEA